MTTARNPQVTDELLSAYLDGAVTDDERHLVETAAAADADVAWRLASLRATVQLLRELPALALPRSFVLTPEQVGQAAPLPATTSNAPMAAPHRKHPHTPQASPGFWAQLAAGWQHFWQAGSPALRNAMAASFAALLVLLAAPRIVAPFDGAQVAHNAAPAAEMAPVALDQVPPPAAPPAAPAEGGAAEAPAEAAVEAAPVAREAVSDTTGTVITLAPAAVQGASAAQPEPDIPPAADEAAEVALLAAANSPEVVVAEISREQLSARDATTFTVEPFAVQRDDALGEAAVAAFATDVPAEVPPGARPAMSVAAPAGGATSADLPAQEPSTATAPAPKAVATTAETQSETTTAAAELRESAPVEATATTAPTAPPPTATPARVAAAGTGDTTALLEKARVISPPSPPTQEAQGISLWPLLQVAAALGAVTFGLLWWRSRRK